MRILHVEDNPFYLEAIKEALRHADDIDLEQVETLKAAKARLDDTALPPFDALFTDLSLPDGRGTDVVTALSAYGIPVVVLSGADLPETLEQATEAGADDYIVKGPIDISRIKMACRRYIKQAEAVASAVSAASSQPPFRSRSLGKEAFEALKPFISCAHVA